MKRFSIFCAALFAAATSFAAVTYELNGGAQSEWENPQAMYDELNAVWNTFSGTSKTWGNLEELKANVANGIPTQAGTMDLTFIADENFKAKFEWLVTYMDAKCTEQGQTLPSSNASFLRYNLQAFFIDGVRASWPVSANYTTCGVSSVDAYQPYWKSGYANPTEPTGEWVLNAPYKEGETFFGWYWNADFSGEKVTKIDATSNGTLYAKFGQYIPTIAEVKAMAEGSETQVAGVVTFIQGKNVYVQDATGGMLLYMAADPTFAVGQSVVVKGTTKIYGGAPEVAGCVEVSAEAGTMPTPLAFENLTPLVNDTELKYFGQLVTVPGVVITEYDSYNNPTLSDGTNSVKGYKMVLDPVAYPIGSKCTITAIAAYYNGFQFVGDPAGIVVAIAGVKDTYDYPIRDSRYKLENKWVISVVEDNYAANKPGGTGFVRGMAAKDGIMYFINRETASIVRVDGKTGNMLEPIKITGENLYQKQNEDGTYADAVTLKFNDIKFDGAGNCLIGCCISAGTSCQPFFIYEVDLETGVATEVINEVLWDNPDINGTAFRFDAFGVNGDIHGNACIMAADASGTFDTYRWLIKDGEVQPGEQISMLLDPEVDEYLAKSAAGWGTAPQIFPQDEEGTLFYADGFNTLPMLFDEGGMLVEDFIKCPAGTALWNNPGDTTTLATGLNGIQEFQVGDEYFFVMIATHTPSTPPSAFGLYKFADEARSFDGIEPLWYFPANGLGSASNGCRTAVPSVEVDGNKATIYLYANDNGYGVYEFTIGDFSGVENVENAIENGARKVVENGQVYIIKNGVKFNVLGAEVK